MYWAPDNSNDYTEEKIYDLAWGGISRGRMKYTARIGDRCLDFVIHTGVKPNTILEGLHIWVPRRRLNKQENRVVNQHIINEFEKPENIGDLY